MSAKRQKQVKQALDFTSPGERRTKTIRDQKMMNKKLESTERIDYYWIENGKKRPWTTRQDLFNSVMKPSNKRL